MSPSPPFQTVLQPPGELPDSDSRLLSCSSSCPRHPLFPSLVKCLLCSSSRLLGPSSAGELFSSTRPTHTSHPPASSHTLTFPPPTQSPFSLGTQGLTCLTCPWAPATMVSLTESSGPGRQCAVRDTTATLGRYVHATLPFRETLQAGCWQTASPASFPMGLRSQEKAQDSGDGYPCSKNSWDSAC